MREARYDIKDPSLEIPKTQYTQGFAKIFGLSGEFSYSSKKDIEGYKDRLLGTDTEEGSIDKYNNQIKTRLEEQKSFLLKQLENETLTADQRKLIKLELDSIDEQLTENEIDRENKKNKVRENVNKQYQESIKARLDLASKVAGSMATIWGEESKVGKGFATAQALIDTYSAANSAYSAMAGIPIVGPALGAAAAAAAIAAGIANVKKIWEVDETSGASASGVSASVSAPANLNTAPVEYTRNLLGDKETDLLNEPVKCYVVESDITNAQTKVAVTESNASF